MSTQEVNENIEVVSKKELSENATADEKGTNMNDEVSKSSPLPSMHEESKEKASTIQEEEPQAPMLEISVDNNDAIMEEENKSDTYNDDFDAENVNTVPEEEYSTAAQEDASSVDTSEAGSLQSPSGQREEEQVQEQTKAKHSTILITPALVSQPSNPLQDQKQQQQQQKQHLSKKEKKFLKAEEIVGKDPYHHAAWNVILGDIREKPIAEVRKYYEKFLDIFPTSSRVWRIYCEHEFESGNREQVQALFQRCLLSNLHVDLWQFYVTFVMRTKGGDDPQQPQQQQQSGREEIEQAFEFALQHVGLDIRSYPLWKDYIDFLCGPLMSSINKQHLNSGMSLLPSIEKVRRIYQRCFSNIPMNGMDMLWKDYERFEQEVNPSTAKLILTEAIAKYKTTVNKLREKKLIRDGILLNMLAVPPSHYTPLLLHRYPFQAYSQHQQSTNQDDTVDYQQQQDSANIAAVGEPQQQAALAAEKKNKQSASNSNGSILGTMMKPTGMQMHYKEEIQKQIWKNLIDLEERNPTKIPFHEQRKFVVLTFNQCLLNFYRDSEMWFLFCHYLIQQGLYEDAVEVFERATKALPRCIFIHLAFAHFLEYTRKDIQKAKSVFERLLQSVLDAAAQIAINVAAAKTAAAAADGVNGTADSGVTTDGSSLALLGTAQVEQQNQIEVGIDVTVVYIQYQKFIRRIEGMDPARDIFIQARKSPYCTWQVYAAAAEIEWKWNNDSKIALKVFEIGLKKFSHEPQYVLHYLVFLEFQYLQAVSTASTTNIPSLVSSIRLLYDKAIASIPKERCLEIWNKYIDFEMMVANNDSILQQKQPTTAQSSMTSSAASAGRDPVQILMKRRFEIYGNSSLAHYQQQQLYLYMTSQEYMTQSPSGTAGNVANNILEIDGIIQQFKYFDLYPLRRKKFTKQVGQVTVQIPESYVKPDLNQMMKFEQHEQRQQMMTAKSEASVRQAQHQQTSGITGIPEAVDKVMRFVLGASSLQFISTLSVPDPEQLMELLKQFELPPLETLMAMDYRGDRDQVEDNHESDTEEQLGSGSALNRPPQNDIFTKRRMKKPRV